MDQLEEISQAGAQLASTTGAPGDAASSAGTQPGAAAASGSQAGFEVLPPLTQAERDRAEAIEWAGYPYLFGSIVGEAMPELKAVYTEAACMAWGEKFLPLARKYGWSAGVVGLWMGAAGATWALLAPTAKVARRYMAQAKQSAQPAPSGSTGSGTGTGTERGQPSGTPSAGTG